MICTGIGSRKINKNIEKQLLFIVKILNLLDIKVRTGDAIGSDACFRKAKNKEVFTANDATERSMRIASQIHQNWNACDEYSRKLHGRNIFQVLGINMEHPSDFLVCWTKDGISKGGSRTAIELAKQNCIPVFNIAKKNDIFNLFKFLKDIYFQKDIDNKELLDVLDSVIDKYV